MNNNDDVDQVSGLTNERASVETAELSDKDAFEPDSLRDAVVLAPGDRPGYDATVEERTTQRRDVALAHEALHLGSRG